ncbi:MAG TPA: class I SAM-dependent methyltransferase [Rhodanobacteraceae bacterium]|nr:class I SAM-dependent methyltransferase [Rhodanobacteraceae bacterium]
MSERGYQYDFSADNEAMHDLAGRQRKAATMLAILGEALGPRLATARLLTVGCSTGIIDEFLAPHVGSVTGIDIDAPAVEAARKRSRAPNATFRTGDAMNLDFADASFDIVICSQVYEHVPDPGRMMAEIRRVLAPDGVCYFAATNRFNIMEQHYDLPFLSVIPVPLAHLYLRMLGRGRYYHERHMTLGGLRRLTADFRVDDFTPKVIADPDRYNAGYMIGTGTKARVIRLFAKVAYWAFPGYLWLLWRDREAVRR